MNICTTASPPRPKLVVGPARRRQSGIATVLVILLTGLALATVVLGAVGYVGGLQARSVSLHAATQAQLQAWSAQEAARQYLAQIGANAAGALTANTPMTFGSSYLSGVTAKVTSVTSNDSTYCGSGQTRAVMTFAGKGGPANSTLESVICVNGSPTAGSYLPTDTINIKGPLTMSGGIQSVDLGNSKLSVDGAISGSGLLTGFDNVTATGNVSLSGGNTLGALTSNGDINISGSFTSVTAFGNVIMNNASGVTGNVSANGTFTDNGGGTYGGLIEAGGNITLANGTKVPKVHSQGNVYGRQSTVSTELMAQGSFNELSCCSKVASGQVGTSVNLTSNRDGSVVTLSVVPGLVVPVTQVPKVVPNAPKIDAYDFLSLANYVFDVDAQYHPTVKVNNVNGLTSGTTYYLVSSGSNSDYLCTTLSYVSNTCPKKICNGWSASNTCFTTPTAGSPNWAIAGAGTTPATTTLAPGVFWFKGKLTLNNGYFFNTFIASGDITTGGSITITAPNYAADPTPPGQGNTWTAGAIANMCNNAMFGSLYPSNLCSDSTHYTPIELGNVSLLSGSYTAGAFSGGHVYVGAQNVITGNIVAGDYLETAGNTTIYGVASAAYQAGGSNSNLFSAGTVFNTKRNIPWTGTPACYGCNTGSITAKVLFSHYQ